MSKGANHEHDRDRQRFAPVALVGHAANAFHPGDAGPGQPGAVSGHPPRLADPTTCYCCRHNLADLSTPNLSHKYSYRTCAVGHTTPISLGLTQQLSERTRLGAKGFLHTHD